MSGLAYAMALFGCSDDATACESLTDKAQAFESRVACEMETATALSGDLALRADYPTVIAQCLSQAQLARLNARLRNGPIDLSRGPALASADAGPRF